ncbi:expansin-B6-like [Nicotiana tabacum]|uniref:Expansin-B6-like n=1 Tax=Nicotiana tabacum TaxID=4097 RepID=A0AC58T402_TOBAC
MAANFPHGLFLWIFVAFCSCLFRFSSCQPSGYSQAVATFYINPTSPGSGGACGLENDVASAPYNAMITAGNQALFKQGAGCGACYQVLCTQNQNPHCSGNLITLTLTDECPGACNNDPVHFDISGIAFGKLAKSGEASQLYNAGRISIFYRRVACNYNTNIIFKVDKGSNPNFFAVTSEAVDGDGDLSLVEIQTSNSSWVPMQRMIGATWSVGMQPNTQKPPFSLRLTSETKQSVTAPNVIPNGWQPRSIYKSNVNFPNKL